MGPGNATPSFERLFSPLKVGPIVVPNRICETTNSIGAGRADGMPDEMFMEHHVAKALGGTGWIGSETWVLNEPLPSEAADEFFPGGVSLRFAAHWMPQFVERMQTFVSKVHDAGAVVVCQLTHLNATFAPSAVPTTELYDAVPHEMDEDEVNFMIDTYAQTAAVFRMAGVDGLEVHCAHECLPQLFLSPATNRRTDQWGGDAKARTLFVREIIRRMREAVGNDLAIGIRFNAREARQGGYDLAEAQEMAGYLADAGGIDFFNVDVGHSWGPVSYVPPSYYPSAAHAPSAKSIKEAIGSIPLLHGGRVTDPVVAEQLLSDGICDLVGMTRAGIADPEFPTKAREGRLDEIRLCIGCNRCIGETVHGTTPMPFRKPVCSVNSEVGNELMWKAQYRPAKERHRVVVAGAGPAGLEAARVAAMRGNEVIILERRSTIGGQLAIASRAPGREDYARFGRYMETQIELLGIDLRLDTALGAEDILALKPDSVVCATGSVAIIPEIPGVDGPTVVRATDVLEGLVTTGDRVAVLSQEDKMVTICVADYLATNGKHVEIFHKWRGVGGDVDRYTIGIALRHLEEGGVVEHVGLRAVAIDGSAIDFASAYTGAHKRFEGFDTIVLSCGSRPETSLYRSLKSHNGKTRSFLTGSAWVPRGIWEATQHGMKVGLEV